MSQPIAVDILSDDDDGDGIGGFHHPRQIDAISTPSPALPKKPKTDFNNSNPTAVFLIDDDPTPVKPSPQSRSERTASTPSFVPETPMSDLLKSEVSIVKCTTKGWGSTSEPNLRACTFTDANTSGINGLIFLESDNEFEHNSDCKAMEQNETTAFAHESTYLLDERYISGNEDITQMNRDSFSQPIPSEDDNPQVTYQFGEEVDRLESLDDVSRVKDISKGRNKGNTIKKRNIDGAAGKKRITEEERVRLMEEKKQKKELEKLQKASQKAEAAKMKKLEKEKQRWKKGKFALKSIVAEIDTKVVELGSVGGHLLTRFAEKGLAYRIASNPIERSIVWTWDIADELSELSYGEIGIPYVLLVFEAEEFCNLVMGEALMSNVSRVRSHYPSHTICYLTNRLMAYINKREQSQYKNSVNYSGWKRPPVEEVLSKLTTNFFKVHSRQCVDEAELAEHIVGLTCSLASCQFRKKLTRLSVNANGSLIPKDCVDKNQVKKSLWLKALIAIPKVQPRFAIAIWKKYPTMKSLLSVYMDPNKPVHEKEFLLKDLMTEGLLGDDRRLGEMCSKRVYRILMAQSGNIQTDDVEEGADFFSHLSS